MARAAARRRRSPSPAPLRPGITPIRAVEEPVAATTLGALCAQVGERLVQVLIAPRGLDAPVRNVGLFDPLDADAVRDGEVSLGIGVDPDRRAALDAVETIAHARGCALVIKDRGHVADALVEQAERLGVALLCAARELDWIALHALMSAAGAGIGDSAVADELAAAPEDLSALVDATAAIAGGPVTIEDAQLRMLAFSSVDGEMDEERIATILARRTPQPIIDRLRTEGIVARVAEADDVVAFTYADMRPRRAIAIRAGGAVLGYVWVAEGATLLTERADAALREAARLAATYMLRHRITGDVARRMRGNLLRALLAGDGPSEVYAQELGLPQRAGFTVVAYDLGCCDPEQLPALTARLVDFVSMHFRSFRREVAVVADGAIVYALVIGEQDGSAEALGRVVRESVTSLRASLKLAARAGIGTHVGELAAVTGSREAALQALHAGELLGAEEVVDIESVRGEALLIEFAQHVAEHPRPRSRQLDRLYEHDRMHGTNYIETLIAYLDCLGSTTLTAERLHIHPNTLRYRIRRLTGVAGVDLDRPSERFALELQLRLTNGDLAAR